MTEQQAIKKAKEKIKKLIYPFNDALSIILQDLVDEVTGKNKDLEETLEGLAFTKCGQVIKKEQEDIYDRTTSN